MMRGGSFGSVGGGDLKTSRHDIDFFSWTQEQAALLRAFPDGFELLDIENLADEIEGMGQAEIHRISSLLYQVLTGLIKIAVAPAGEGVRRQYEEIIGYQTEAIIKTPPGLEKHLDLPKVWKVAANGATRALERAGVDIPVLPEACPLTLDELLEPEFNPNVAAKKLAAAISSSV